MCHYPSSLTRSQYPPVFSPVLWFCLHHQKPRESAAPALFSSLSVFQFHDPPDWYSQYTSLLHYRLCPEHHKWVFCSRFHPVLTGTDRLVFHLIFHCWYTRPSERMSYLTLCLFPLIFIDIDQPPWFFTVRQHNLHDSAFHFLFRPSGTADKSFCRRMFTGWREMQNERARTFLIKL